MAAADVHPRQRRADAGIGLALGLRERLLEVADGLRGVVVRRIARAAVAESRLGLRHRGVERAEHPVRLDVGGCDLQRLLGGVIDSPTRFCRRYTPASSAVTSAAIGSSAIARLYAAIGAIEFVVFETAARADTGCTRHPLSRTRPAPAAPPRGARDGSVRLRRPLTRETRRAELPASWVELFHKNRGAVILFPPMAIDPELLDILACPQCKTAVTLVKNGTA